MTSTSAEQTEAIRQSMQDEKVTKDEVIRELVEALRDVKSDLFYQIESRHGPKAARNYPSMGKADAALRKAGAL
jgi:hypothetical protein